MTPNQAKITIVNPCSENWDSMSVDTVGRFCQSCQKSVIDFSSKSDDEIKTFLKDKQGEKLCGRFYVHQVERIRIEIDQNILVSDTPFWQKFLVILLVCFGTDFLGIDFAFAQTETDSVPVKTEQIDSLSPVIPVAETDSLAEALEVTPDSLLLKPVQPKHPQVKSDLKSLTWLSPITGMMMGTITAVPEGYFFPELNPSIILNEQEEDDPVVPQAGTAMTSKKNPAVPKSPRKKPAIPENAVIADATDRRKTRKG